jgi:hypothetical protein
MQILHELKGADDESSADDYVFAGQRNKTVLLNRSLRACRSRMRKHGVKIDTKGVLDCWSRSGPQSALAALRTRSIPTTRPARRLARY